MSGGEGLEYGVQALNLAAGSGLVVFGDEIPNLVQAPDRLAGHSAARHFIRENAAAALDFALWRRP
jgi:hypothetical protein